MFDNKRCIFTGMRNWQGNASSLTKRGIENETGRESGF
jgi:hypothetical protein